MTLRELLDSCRYKSVFNVIYKHYYKGKSYSNSELTEIDVRYYKVWGDIKELPPSDSDGLCLSLGKKNEPEASFIDVFLCDEKKNETFALDFFPWSKLIDMNIKREASPELTNDEVLAHILWEITFWGYTESEIEKQKSITENSAKEASVELEDLFNL
jgi:hypothetical protein